LGAIVGNNGVRHPKLVDDVREKGHGLFGLEVCDWACFDPLGELVYGNQQVGVAPGRLSQGPDDVQPPHSERACDRYVLQGMSQKVGLAGVKLAPLAGVHDLVGVSDRSGPIKALAERVAAVESMI
jgi:hypothetical protein